MHPPLFLSVSLTAHTLNKWLATSHVQWTDPLGRQHFYLLHSNISNAEADHSLKRGLYTIMPWAVSKSLRPNPFMANHFHIEEIP